MKVFEEYLIFQLFGLFLTEHEKLASKETVNLEMR